MRIVTLKRKSSGSGEKFDYPAQMKVKRASHPALPYEAPRLVALPRQKRDESRRFIHRDTLLLTVLLHLPLSAHGLLLHEQGVAKRSSTFAHSRSNTCL